MGSAVPSYRIHDFASEIGSWLGRYVGKEMNRKEVKSCAALGIDQGRGAEWRII